ncbi:MAG TPA: hypothetical protein PLU30_18120 [Verrucomicrobiae bacterium]|nr:hypothetical protein [Verrucomicrobiae bacterium]
MIGRGDARVRCDRCSGRGYHASGTRAIRSGERDFEVAVARCPACLGIGSLEAGDVLEDLSLWRRHRMLARAGGGS